MGLDKCLYVLVTDFI